ncbi:apolipoprotein N-acyltransferase [Saccharopolyspora antimicrobica]|uniref:Apolipoprotein N-acyltransferase n=1 Tax=Saccharopolyspora antimicrobica TaxID=455193 RepID=A0A1I4XI99_9PSEU|nr:hypothetical protein [Saccharopolyspora antimicrobica]SFN25223.1 apolipoprotein N-acyltransferase [Saccharopolyspora antimicrobica]
MFPALGGDPVPHLKQHDTVSPPGNAEAFPPTTGARLGLEICADVNFRNPTSAFAAGGPTRFTALVAEVPTGPGPTPYAHLGDWFPWLCLAFAAIAVVVTRGERATS